MRVVGSGLGVVVELSVLYASPFRRSTSGSAADLSLQFFCPFRFCNKGELTFCRFESDDANDEIIGEDLQTKVMMKYLRDGVIFCNISRHEVVSQSDDA